MQPRHTQNRLMPRQTESLNDDAIAPRFTESTANASETNGKETSVRRLTQQILPVDEFTETSKRSSFFAKQNLASSSESAAAKPEAEPLTTFNRPKTAREKISERRLAARPIGPKPAIPCEIVRCNELGSWIRLSPQNLEVKNQIEVKKKAEEEK